MREIHANFHVKAEKIFSCFPHLKYLAIDLLIKDPLQDAVVGNYVVSEVGTYPGFSLFTHPTVGQGYNVLKPIIDGIFPETVNL